MTLLVLPILREATSMILKAEPTKTLASLDELMALALAMEQQAAGRYAALAQHMRGRGLGALADLFARLAAEESNHARSVERWAEQRLGAVPRAAGLQWLPPATFDDNAANELAASRLISGYRVLAMAVRNEERAFQAWSYIAAQTESDEVREAAERMAHEELEHVALLRAARRAAWRDEGRHRRPRRARSVRERLAGMATLEGALAAALAGDPERQDLAAASRAMAEELAGMAGGAAPAVVSAPDSAIAAEQLAEDYLDLIDGLRDEAIVSRLQAMARHAIDRLPRLTPAV